MARSVRLPDPDGSIRKMEGLAQKLGDMPPELRPEQLTHIYLANQFGVSVSSVKGWLADCESRRARNDDADLFCELWQRIAGYLGERVAAMTFKIALDVTNRNAFNAQKFLLPRIDAETWSDDDRKSKAHRNGGLSVGDIPQEVWDELDEAELAQLDEIEAAVNAQMTRLEILVRHAQKRVADRAVAGAESLDY